jgi:hypothetical protein
MQWREILRKRTESSKSRTHSPNDEDNVHFVDGVFWSFAIEDMTPAKAVAAQQSSSNFGFVVEKFVQIEFTVFQVWGFRTKS